MQFWAPDGGRKTRLKRVERLIEINKVWNVASCWLKKVIHLQARASSMTAALEGGEWSAARPSLTLPPGKTRYPFYKGLVGTQGRSGRMENLVHTRIRSRTIQPVVSRYTDWATRPTHKDILQRKQKPLLH